MRSLCQATLWVATIVTALAQTPPNFKPSTDQHLSISYNGLKVLPGMLFPQNITTRPPNITSRQSASGRYVVALIDPTIEVNELPPSIAHNTTGLGPNQTTFLHWLQTDLTISDNGTLSPGNVSAAAGYLGPLPQAGKPPHTYVFLLLSQPPTFQLPSQLASGALADPTNYLPRLSFDIGPIASQQGVKLLEANWMLVQNANNNVSSTGTSRATSTSPTASVSTSTCSANTSVPAAPGSSVGQYTGAASRTAAALPAIVLGALAAAVCN